MNTSAGAVKNFDAKDEFPLFIDVISCCQFISPWNRRVITRRILKPNHKHISWTPQRKYLLP